MGRRPDIDEQDRTGESTGEMDEKIETNEGENIKILIPDSSVSNDSAFEELS